MSVGIKPSLGKVFTMSVSKQSKQHKPGKHECTACGQRFSTLRDFDRHKRGDWEDWGRHRYCTDLATGRFITWVHRERRNDPPPTHIAPYACVDEEAYVEEDRDVYVLG
jgi:hypothetical protein